MPTPEQSQANLERSNGLFVGFVLLIVVILLLFGGLRRWNYGRNGDYASSGGFGLVLIIVIIWMVMRRM
jgi:uncharacterized membrane protein